MVNSVYNKNEDIMAREVRPITSYDIGKKIGKDECIDVSTLIFQY